MVPELKDLPYEERLKELELTTLKERRVRGDMIETYKIITGKEDIDPSKFFEMKQADRGDPALARGLKISKKRWNFEPRSKTFSIRIENTWNALEKVEVESTSISDFKKNYDTKEKLRKAARRADIYQR